MSSISSLLGGSILIQQLHSSGDRPFSMTLAYYDKLEGTNIELKINMIYNMTCLFSQVQQLEQILIQYNEQEVIVNRNSIVEWFEEDVIHLKTEAAIMEKIRLKLIHGAELPI